MSDLFILNVYLPTDMEEHLDDFRMYLYKIHTIFTSSPTVNNVVMGDFNANIIRKCSRFGIELKCFSNREGYHICDEIALPDDSFTY